MTGVQTCALPISHHHLVTQRNGYATLSQQREQLDVHKQAVNGHACINKLELLRNAYARPNKPLRPSLLSHQSAPSCEWHGTVRWKRPRQRL